MDGRIPQDDHLRVNDVDRGRKGGIGRVGSSTIPSNNQAPLIEEHTELAAHNPSVIGFPLAPDLHLTAPFAQRMEQFSAIALDHFQSPLKLAPLVRSDESLHDTRSRATDEI